MNAILDCGFGSESLVRDVEHHYGGLECGYRAVWGDLVHHGLWCHGNASHALAVTALAVNDIIVMGNGFS